MLARASRAFERPAPIGAPAQDVAGRHITSKRSSAPCLILIQRQCRLHTKLVGARRGITHDKPRSDPCEPAYGFSRSGHEACIYSRWQQGSSAPVLDALPAQDLRRATSPRSTNTGSNFDEVEVLSTE